MDMVKALRRSMKSERHKAQNSSISSKSAVAIIPPKKVIRANDDYQPDDALIQNFAKAGMQVLGFSKGDFFHVIGREDDLNWYEACNPALPDARGLVPVSYFQVLGRTERDSSQSDGGRFPVGLNPDHDSGYGETSLQTSPSSGHRTSKPAKTGGILHATVHYTFTADPGRPDELSAEKGEPLIIIAQSNREWVVAKPIGRLGGPGLIPIGFINIYDESSYRTVPPVAVDDPLDALRKAGVPSVEEWKKMAAQYKNSSITLGKFYGSRGQTAHHGDLESGMQRMSLQQGHNDIHHSHHQRAASDQHAFQQVPHVAPPTSQLQAPVWARIPRYCFAEDKYWFVIEAELEDGRCWELSRYYQDFYDFQIALLAEFPTQAGNTGTQKRSLPYMPGPVSYVTDAITEGRLYNLDAYVKNLLSQPPNISQCDLVKLFFAPREGDYEIDNITDEEGYRLSQGSRPSSDDTAAQTPSSHLSRGYGNGLGYGSPAGSAMHSQGSSPSHVDSLSQQSNQTLAPAIKIKVRFKDDVIAMRVPSDIPYHALHQKIRERVKAGSGEQVQLFYQDEPSASRRSLQSDGDFDQALRLNEKLTLFVEVF